MEELQRKYEELEKRVAALEGRVQAQQINKVVIDITNLESFKDVISEINKKIDMVSKNCLMSHQGL